PVGYYFEVMTKGYGGMPSYSAQVGPEDRWGIVAYIRVLQMSQHTDPAKLPPELQKLLGEAGGKKWVMIPRPTRKPQRPRHRRPPRPRLRTPTNPTGRVTRASRRSLPSPGGSSSPPPGSPICRRRPVATNTPNTTPSRDSSSATSPDTSSG